MKDANDITPPPITGATRLYPIIGDPIDQVGSPAILNPLLRARGAAAVVLPFHVPAGGLPRAFAALSTAGNVDGIMVTVPHKPGMAALVDRLGALASHTGAINVARREPDGRWFGDTTDGLGFVNAARTNGRAIAGARVLLVGAGGAGGAVGHSLAAAGIAAISIFDLDVGKADALAAGIAGAHPGVAVSRVAAAAPAGHDIIINATPTGMGAGDSYPLAVDQLSGYMYVADLITKPEITPLLAAARERGCATQLGREMIAGQADAILDFFGFGGG